MILLVYYAVQQNDDFFVPPFCHKLIANNCNIFLNKQYFQPK